MAGLNGDSGSLSENDVFNLFTAGGDYQIGGSPGAAFPVSDSEVTAGSGPLASSITPPHSDRQPVTPSPPPPPPQSDTLLLDLFPDIANFYGNYSGPAVPTGAYDYGKTPEDFGRVASSPPAPSRLEDPEPLFGEGVSGTDRLYPSPPSPLSFSGTAFAPGAYDLGENPQGLRVVASSAGAAFPLAGPRPIHPLAASSPLASSSTGEGPSGALPVWLDRPASTPAFPVASASAAAEGPLRRASAPDCLAAFAPVWDAPWVPAPPTAATNGWTAGPALGFGPAVAFGDAPPDTTTDVDWDALFGLAPPPTAAPAWTAAPVPAWTAAPVPAWTAAPAPATTTRQPLGTPPPAARPAAAAPAPITPPRSGSSGTPTTATTMRTVLLPSTTTTLLSTANAAAASRKRPRSPIDGVPPNPPAKRKAGPGRRAKYDGMSGFLVATVADAGALGHREGPTTQVLAPRSGRWRKNGGVGEKKGGKKEGE